jgi:hypothetical protein
MIQAFEITNVCLVIRPRFPNEVKRNHNPWVVGSSPIPATNQKCELFSDINDYAALLRRTIDGGILPVLTSNYPVLTVSDATVMPAFGSLFPSSVGDSRRAPMISTHRFSERKHQVSNQYSISSLDGNKRQNQHANSGGNGGNRDRQLVKLYGAKRRKSNVLVQARKSMVA